jgi:hypothetical protein
MFFEGFTLTHVPVPGGTIQSGRYIAKEKPAELLAWFERFFE